MSTAAETTTGYDPRTDYPRWDESHATTLVSTEKVHVEHDVLLSEDGTALIMRRTVWTKTYRAKDRDILWTGDIAVIPRNEMAAFARDLVGALI